MRRYAVLLRGVNVGGRGKLPMADFRQVLESLGHGEVKTYLQSGNAVVASPEPDPGRLAGQIHDALARELGLDTVVMVRTGAELADVMADNPFPSAVAKPPSLHVAFLAAEPDRTRAAKLDQAAYAPDEFRFGDRVVYLHLPDGIGRSKLPPAVLGRLDVAATARNWNTVVALAGMTEPGGGKGDTR
jgi:uncharacterized protein (DUF1697 family)